MIHSVAGALAGGALTDRRPFRAPHHSASMAALVGGGVQARPGEISLAHHGVLFLDELPEFQPQVLDSLRQPIETGEVAIARANHRVVYPARFQLVAAMNPCRCGHANDPGYACKRAPERALRRRISRPAVGAAARPLRPRHRRARGDGRRPDAAAAARRLGRGGGPRRRRRATIQRDALCRARPRQRRLQRRGARQPDRRDRRADDSGLRLLRDAAERMRLTARGYHRVLKLARTLADLDGDGPVGRAHLAEALSYRGAPDRAAAAA